MARTRSSSRFPYSYWLYGAAMGLLLLLLEVIEYRTLVVERRLELFGGLIALLFLALGIWVGNQVFRKKPPPTTPPAPVDPATLGISKREAEVLELMVAGLSNQEIADRLFVSLNTVKTHVSNLYQKLEVQRRAQAIQKAQQLTLKGE